MTTLTIVARRKYVKPSFVRGCEQFYNAIVIYLRCYNVGPGINIHRFSREVVTWNLLPHIRIK